MRRGQHQRRGLAEAIEHRAAVIDRDRREPQTVSGRDAAMNAQAVRLGGEGGGARGSQRPAQHREPVREPGTDHDPVGRDVNATGSPEIFGKCSA